MPGENRWAARVQSYYKPRQVGVAVFKMLDGSYFVSRQVPGVKAALLKIVFREPSQPVPRRDQVNQTMATSWVNGKPTEFPQRPDVDIVYYGGTSYPVSADEAADLEAAGLGDYVTSELS